MLSIGKWSLAAGNGNDLAATGKRQSHAKAGPKASKSWRQLPNGSSVQMREQRNMSLLHTPLFVAQRSFMGLLRVPVSMVDCKSRQRRCCFLLHPWAASYPAGPEPHCVQIKTVVAELRSTAAAIKRRWLSKSHNQSPKAHGRSTPQTKNNHWHEGLTSS